MDLYHYGYPTCAGVRPRVYVSNLDFGPFSNLLGRNVHPPESNRWHDGIYRDTGYHPPRCLNTELWDNCWGVSSTWVRRLNNAYKWLTHEQNTLSILFVMTAMQLVFGIIFAGFEFDLAGFSKTNFIWVITIGIAGLMAHLCLTTALSLAPTTLVSPIDFLRLPVIAVVIFCFLRKRSTNFRYTVLFWYV